MNKKALFSDRGPNYVVPVCPEPGQTVVIRLRAGAGEVTRADLRWYKCIEEGIFEEIPMRWSATDGQFDWFEAELPVGEDPICYSFRVRDDRETLEVDAGGCPFRLFPGFQTPDWAKGAVFYQIFTDRFANGDEANDVVDEEYIYIDDQPVKRVKDWTKAPDPTRVEFYGGDLQGVMDHLDDLAGLGIDAIYFNPLFVSPSNHKYDTQDYEHIDPHFGRIVKDAEGPDRYRVRTTSAENLEASDALFAELVKEAHSRGIRVILDGVFNHCGSWNRFMDAKGLYAGNPAYDPGAIQGEKSPYRTYFHFEESSSEYEGWWGYETLPKLNYEGSDDLKDYIFRVAQRWLLPPFDADGWRLDVAADLGHSEAFNHAFFREFRQKVKAAKADALILAEHYDDPMPWLAGDQWDSVMNYKAFMEPVGWYLTGMEKHCDEKKEALFGNVEAFWKCMTEEMNRLPYPALMTAMNELSNHDHARFLTRTNGMIGRTADAGPAAADAGVKPALMRAAVLIQMTWPGAPTLYYGDEAGMTGWTDPDNRRTYPWGNEDETMLGFHREMIRIRKKSQALKTGSLKALDAGEHVLAYARFSPGEKMVVLINPTDQARTVNVPVWEAEMTDEMQLSCRMWSDDQGYRMDDRLAKLYISHGNARITVPAQGAVLLEAERRTLWQEDRK